jgi:hypothetical protein
MALRKNVSAVPAVAVPFGNAPTKNDPLLTSEQACVELGNISSKTLGRLRAKKAIGFITINPGNYRYRKFAHVEAFLNRRETKTRAAYNKTADLSEGSRRLFVTQPA